jgi:hypothetical protein
VELALWIAGFALCRMVESWVSSKALKEIEVKKYEAKSSSE